MAASREQPRDEVVAALEGDVVFCDCVMVALVTAGVGIVLAARLGMPIGLPLGSALVVGAVGWLVRGVRRWTRR